MQKLRKKFEGYLNVVSSKLVKTGKVGGGNKRVLHLRTNEPFELRTLVLKLEQENSFGKLVEETMSEFGIDDASFLETFPLLYDTLSKYIDVEDLGLESLALFESPEEVVKIAISNFFCRSGCYFNIFRKSIPDTDKLFEEYCNAFKKKEIKKKYLIPLGNVGFSRPSMNFGEFEIKKFSLQELDTILQNNINKVFYQYASVNLERLIRFWYVYAERTVNPLEGLGWESLESGKQEFSYHSYGVHPKSLESVLQNIALFDWERKIRADDQGRTKAAQEWLGIHLQEISENTVEEGFSPGFKRYMTPKLFIPFNLITDDNLLSDPQLPAVHGQFNMDRDFQAHLEWNPQSYYFFRFNNEQSNEFENFLKNSINLLDEIKNRKEEWGFINYALEQLNKAFFSEMPEELLAHITMIECLLGGGDERGVRETLARRITRILGKNQNEKKLIRKQFNELYSIRGKLVHGIRIEKKDYKEYSFVAWHMAREVGFWFLKILNALQKQIPSDWGDKDIPKREDILKLIDLDKPEKLRVKFLLDNPPFPP